MIENLATATPSEIDTVLADLYDKAWALGMECSRRVDAVFYEAGAKRVSRSARHRDWNMTLDEATAVVEARASEGNEKSWERAGAQHVLDALADARKASAANRDEQAPLHAEFTRRGGWTRAFLVVTQGTGHVHSSMHCSTCFDTTQFAWLPELSGSDETAIVAAAGQDACTVCYPSAPVDTAGPRSIYSKGERKTAEERATWQAELAEKRAVREAKAIYDVDGSTLRDGHGFEIKTERTAQTVYVNAAADAIRYAAEAEGPIASWVTRGHDEYRAHLRTLAVEYAAQAERVLAALAAKRATTVEEQREALARKVSAKVKQNA
jgi:hypothetical protein